MSTDEEQIRTLIERWAQAVHDGDLERVVADHSEDIVMFDVPPPHEGVRGVEAYRKSWPPFLRWQAQGALFEIVSLDVTAGDDVAFAQALLRCGMPDDDPDRRLRLTLGLRKEGGRWVVTHEHHSFPITDVGAAEQEVRLVHQRWFEASAVKDLDHMMAAIARDVVSYEHEAPLQYEGVTAVRQVCARGLEASAEVSWDVPDLKVLVREDLAVAWGLNRIRNNQDFETWSRGTRVFERRGGTWVMIHQHVSFPFDPRTGEAKTDLRP
ncbi:MULTISPECIES: nuclear transport factor 2 family protein [unclassified Streptosporangium]|uniref:nuclear transport factor 2 family protein n=1 Tax=unclassified Streptosporangium TaxID=2632669 RepID=UPI003F497C23